MTRDQAGRSPSATTVAVVGAGLSGLTAARELHRRGVDVIVLEAADRVGGRAMSETTVLGSRVDLGGQWIGHDHHRVIDLAAEFGASRFRMHTRPLPVVISGSRRIRAAGPTMLSAGVVLGAVEVASRIRASQRFNATTVAAWLNRLPARTARRLLEVIALISWTGDLDRVSIHAMASMVRRQGGLATMLSTKGGAQESLLVEGVGSLVDGLAAGLGERVWLNRRVTAIVCDDRGVTLRTGSGDLRAAKVIVTVPSPVIDRIEFDPPLPPDRIALCRNTYMGSVYKAIAVYERPFWRERSGGEFIVLDNPGRAVFDTTPPGGPGHLCVLVAGPEARQLDRLDPAGRRGVVLDALARRVGPEVLEPAGWHEKSWHRDENVGGGYIALPCPGTTEGLLPVASAAVGDIHWAGSETAAHHPGYLDGAIESGIRAASEVSEAVRALGNPDQ
ncbi:flavin monoamine oxidase family protein [Mycobacterium sp. NPDC003449]